MDEPPKIKGVWPVRGKFLAAVRVGRELISLGSFPTMEAAISRVGAAERLRDERKSAGLPLTRSEVLGGPAEGDDCFSPVAPEVFAVRRRRSSLNRDRKRVLAILEDHPQLWDELDGLSKERRRGQK